MIVPLVTTWLASQGDPATVGVTGMALATGAWVLLQLAPVDAGRPVRAPGAVIAAARARRGRPASLRVADLWVLSTDIAPTAIPPAPGGSHDWWAPEDHDALAYVLALAARFTPTGERELEPEAVAA